MQHHWCSRLLKGEKSVELRDYPLPAQHVGKAHLHMADEPSTRAVPATPELDFSRAQPVNLQFESFLILSCHILALPAAGQPVVLLSTPIGQEGVAVLGDAVTGQDEDVRLVGAQLHTQLCRWFCWSRSALLLDAMLPAVL